MKPNEHASQRTKNRFREHNLVASELAIKHVGTTATSTGWEGKHFRCINHCEWTGWLPTTEITEE